MTSLQRADVSTSPSHPTGLLSCKLAKGGRGAPHSVTLFTSVVSRLPTGTGDTENPKTVKTPKIQT